MASDFMARRAKQMAAEQPSEMDAAMSRHPAGKGRDERARLARSVPDPTPPKSDVGRGVGRKARRAARRREAELRAALSERQFGAEGPTGGPSGG